MFPRPFKYALYVFQGMLLVTETCTAVCFRPPSEGSDKMYWQFLAEDNWWSKKSLNRFGWFVAGTLISAVDGERCVDAALVRPLTNHARW